MDKSIPIYGIDYLELYVGNARQAVHFYQTALGFEPFAYLGPETGVNDRVSYALRQGNIQLVLTSPLHPTSEVAGHVHMHGDGVKVIALQTNDALHAFQYAISRGARHHLWPTELEDEGGKVKISGIHAYGDTIHLFVEREEYNGQFLPGYTKLKTTYQAISTGLTEIDHLMGNVGWSERDYWCKFYEEVLGFYPKSSFDDSDLSGRSSTLMCKDTGLGVDIRFPITEPTDNKSKSRVEKFLTFYKGPGVQHIALGTHNIIQTVSQLLRSGVQFQHVEKKPHQELIDKMGNLNPKLKELDQLGIMIDRDAESYLFQIFTKPIMDRPTVCYEIIQRVPYQDAQSGYYAEIFQHIH